VYKTRSKRAEEAHEAIRPSSVQRTPKALKESLSRDQYRLYQLIWRRFVASQMKPAEYDTISVQILGAGEEHEYLFRASGSILVFQGYLLVYEESLQESGEDEGKNGSKIPASLEEDQRQEMIELHPEQHFTQPPPRFSEATLVRSLEEFGIGRPSTYAATINTLQQRGYVYRDGRRLFPNDVAMLVNDLLVEHFPQIVDINFTAEMENDLDRIANGEEEWKDVIREFYGPFSEKLERAKIEMPETKAEPELVGRTCPTCNEGDLIIKWGRYGRFIGCSNFPDCRHTEPFLEKIGVLCPLDGGDVVERRTRKGRTFYGCSHYPECEFTSWKKPIATPCPNCKGTLVLSTKRFAQCLDCENQYPVEEVQPEEVPESA
jgi:DNA topoisomerase-1